MTPLAALPCKRSLFTFLCVLFLLCVSTLQAIGQSTWTQANAPSQPKPVSLPHLYWHFLIHQNDLDNMATKLEAKGRDGNPLRNDLQTRLGFSDADFAPVRTSSQRLASEMSELNEQMKALQPSPSNAPQFKALLAQRESFINNEVYSLSLELSPQNKATLEKFMAQFFAPRQITVHAPPTGASEGRTVAK